MLLEMHFCLTRTGLGLDIKSSLGLGLLTRAFGSKGVMERDSVFGWIPESKAGNQEDEAQLKKAQDRLGRNQQACQEGHPAAGLLH